MTGNRLNDCPEEFVQTLHQQPNNSVTYHSSDRRHQQNQHHHHHHHQQQQQQHNDNDHVRSAAKHPIHRRTVLGSAPDTTMQTNDDFMQSPLVTWAQTLLDENCDFHELCNGNFLNRAWLQIDPNPAYHFNQSNENGNGVQESLLLEHLSSHQNQISVLQNQQLTRRQQQLNRIRALWTLLNNVRTFYENVLNQVLVIRLPDVVNIAIAASAEGDSEWTGLNKCLTNASLDEDIRSFLLLILGCAVQCDQKELFIDKIKQLDIGIQHAIVESIQQITDNPDSVFLVNDWASPPEDDAEKDRLYGIFVSHISRLSKERDQLYQRVVELSCEIVNLSTSAFVQDGHPSSNGFSGTSGGGALTRRSLSNSSLNNAILMDSQMSKSHVLVELADAKSKLRRLQQELDEKNEALAELKEALEQSKLSCNKLRTENLELSQEVRNAKAYRDEIDVLNERVRKVDRLESEAAKYRERLNELDFFKSRVDELREDNRILVDTKAMLEEQLDSARKRNEKLPELEERILKLSAYGNELNLQRELDKNQIERLIEELAHLKQEKKAANDELSRIQTELADLKQQARFDAETKRSEEGASLMDQINQDNHKRLIKLEHENKKLQNVIDDYQASYVDIDSLISLVGATVAPVSLTQEEDGQRSAEGQCDSGCFSSAKSKTEKLNELRDYVDRLRAAQTALKNAESVKSDLETVNCSLKSQLSEHSRKADEFERQLSAQSNEVTRLQRSLEKKSKLIETLDAELQSCRTEIATLQANSDNSKQMLKKLNQLEIVTSSIESERDRFEQANKSAEKEIVRLKALIQSKDDLIDQSTDKVDALENDYRRVKKELEVQSVVCNRARDLELENKDLANAKAVAMSTLASLQAELIEEKLAVQRHSADLESVKDVLDKYISDMKLNDLTGNGEDSLPVVIHRCLKSKREDHERTEEMTAGIKAQNTELQGLVEGLKQQLTLAESTRNDSEVLAELQQKNQALEDELKSLKDDFGNERDSQAAISGELKEAKDNLAQVQAKFNELQSESAKWQVENSLLKSQNSSLEAQTADLRNEMLNIQRSIQQLQSKCDEYEQSHQNLMNDYESLQNIHQQLSVDYDHLNQSNGILKQTNKSLKNSKKTLEDELQETITKTNTELAALREQMESGDGDEERLKGRITSLQDENKVLGEELSRIQNEREMLQNMYKKLRKENNDLKLKYTELQGELAKCQDRMNSMQTDMSKLTSYCETVKMADTALDVQRKRLNSHSTTLMAQYNELVNEILTNGGFNQECVQKMKDLKQKGDRHMKRLGEYDSFEGNVQRDFQFTNNNNPSLDHGSVLNAGTHMPERETIYGRLWEAQTGSLENSALLRQYSLNSNVVAKNSPPRIPPRMGNLSGASTPTRGVLQNVAIQHLNTNETVIEVGTAGHMMDNKMSINVSTRGGVSTSASASAHSTASTLKNGVELISFESQSSKLQIFQSPKVQSNFMRGSFKSNSVNYGNFMRQSPKQSPSQLSPHSGQNAKSLSSQKAIQLNRNIGLHLSTPPSPALSSVGTPTRPVYQNHPHIQKASLAQGPGTPQSFHSDSSSSSHSPQEIERIVENGKSDQSHVSGNNVNGGGAPGEMDKNPKAHAIWYEYGCV